MLEENFMATYLPYCLERIEEGKYVVRNWKFNLIGLTKGLTKLNLGEYTGASTILGITPELAAKLSWNHNPDIEQIYLYSYQCDPGDNEANMSSYLEKIKTLATLKIKPDP